jgi:hypothetical protein
MMEKVGLLPALASTLHAGSRVARNVTPEFALRLERGASAIDSLVNTALNLARAVEQGRAQFAAAQKARQSR